MKTKIRVHPCFICVLLLFSLAASAQTVALNSRIAATEPKTTRFIWVNVTNGVFTPVVSSNVAYTRLVLYGYLYATNNTPPTNNIAAVYYGFPSYQLTNGYSSQLFVFGASATNFNDNYTWDVAAAQWAKDVVAAGASNVVLSLNTTLRQWEFVTTLFTNNAGVWYRSADANPFSAYSTVTGSTTPPTVRPAPEMVGTIAAGASFERLAPPGTRYNLFDLYLTASRTNNDRVLVQYEQ